MVASALFGMACLVLAVLLVVLIALDVVIWEAGFGDLMVGVGVLLAAILFFLGVLSFFIREEEVEELER